MPTNRLPTPGEMVHLADGTTAMIKQYVRTRFGHYVVELAPPRPKEFADVEAVYDAQWGWWQEVPALAVGSVELVSSARPLPTPTRRLSPGLVFLLGALLGYMAAWLVMS